MAFDHYLEDIVEIALKADFNTTEYLFKKHIGTLRAQCVFIRNEIDRKYYPRDDYDMIDSLEKRFTELNKTIQHMEMIISSQRCKL